MAKSEDSWGPFDVYTEVLTPFGTFGINKLHVLTFRKDAEGVNQPIETKVEVVTTPTPTPAPEPAAKAETGPPAAPKKTSKVTK